MRFLIVFPALIISLSCNFNNCDADGIIIEAALLEQAQKTGFPYCLSIQKALKKDEIALLQLIRFAYKTDDATAIEHGIVFTELALKLGDDFVSNFVSKQKDEHRLLIAKMFDACMEYREPPVNLQVKLPKTLQILTNKQ